jgi:ferredoxin
MKVIADKSRCIGAGQCVMAAPEIFAQDEDDGLVVIKFDAIPEQQAADVELAVLSCPTRALSLDADLASSQAGS